MLANLSYIVHNIIICHHIFDCTHTIYLLVNINACNHRTAYLIHICILEITNLPMHGSILMVFRYYHILSQITKIVYSVSQTTLLFGMYSYSGQQST